MRNKMLWLLLVIAVVLLMLFPVVYNIIRLGIIAGLVAVWSIGIYLFWKNRFARVLFLSVLLIVVLVCIIPGKAADKGTLRNAFLDSLMSYENVKYVWGGETRLGIDCSGLIREAYVEANLRLGITTANPRLIRKAVKVWLVDCGANTMGNGYSGMTQLVRDVESLDKLNGKDIISGDIVVAKTGFHILAYIGNDTLIEASPKKGKVAAITIKDKAKEWKGVPIKLIRWSDM